MDFPKVKERIKCIINNRENDTFIVLNALAALEILHTYDVVPAKFVDIIVTLRSHLHMNINMKKLKKGVYDKNLSIAAISDSDTDAYLDDSLSDAEPSNTVERPLDINNEPDKAHPLTPIPPRKMSNSSSDSPRSNGSGSNIRLSKSSSELSEDDFLKNVPIEDKITKMLKEDAKQIESMLDHQENDPHIVHTDEINNQLSRSLFDMFDLDKDGYLSCFETLRLYNLNAKHNFILSGAHVERTMVNLLITHKRISFRKFQRYILADN